MFNVMGQGAGTASISAPPPQARRVKACRRRFASHLLAICRANSARLRIQLPLQLFALAGLCLDRLLQLADFRPEPVDFTLEIASALTAEDKHNQRDQDQRSAAQAYLLGAIIICKLRLLLSPNDGGNRPPPEDGDFKTCLSAAPVHRLVIRVALTRHLLGESDFASFFRVKRVVINVTHFSPSNI